MDVLIIILYGLGALFILAALLPLIMKKIFNEGSVASICFGAASVLCAFLLSFGDQSNILCVAGWISTAFTGICFLAGLIISAVMIFTIISGEQNVKKVFDKSCGGTEDNFFVLILGCRLYGNTPTKALKGRVDRGSEILSMADNTIAVVSGGQGSDEQMSEALAMKNYIVEKNNFPEERIIAEDRSTSTAENFRFSLPLIKKYCEENHLTSAKLIIVSDGFHLLRAKLLAKRQGVNNAEYGAACTISVDFPIQWIREILALLNLMILGRDSR